MIWLNDEFDAVIDSLELMADKDFMDSYNKSKEQVKKGEFVDWNEILLYFFGMVGFSRFYHGGQSPGI
ncbi:MAG: hypothetical protein ACOCQG_05120 [Candidatus Nanoarchaeia archaeon]